MDSSTQSSFDLNLTLGLPSITTPNPPSNPTVASSSAGYDGSTLEELADDLVIKNSFSQTTNLVRRLKMRATELRARNAEVQNLKQEVVLLKQAQLSAHQDLKKKQTTIKELKKLVKHSKTVLEPHIAELKEELRQRHEIQEKLLEEIERLVGASTSKQPPVSK